MREGGVFFLPQRVRDSPKRPVPGGVGVVIEPKRPDGAVDAFEWYCFECGALVHRAEVMLKSLVDDLPPIFSGFYDDTAARSCAECGSLHPGKTPPAGWITLPPMPVEKS